MCDNEAHEGPAGQLYNDHIRICRAVKCCNPQVYRPSGPQGKGALVTAAHVHQAGFAKAAKQQKHPSMHLRGIVHSFSPWQLAKS